MKKSPIVPVVNGVICVQHSAYTCETAYVFVMRWRAVTIHWDGNRVSPSWIKVLSQHESGMTRSSMDLIASFVVLWHSFQLLLEVLDRPLFVASILFCK